jgi:diguanylate cyclase (GGDEF)-like protein/PAS domain S-box-containing protein
LKQINYSKIDFIPRGLAKFELKPQGVVVLGLAVVFIACFSLNEYFSAPLPAQAYAVALAGIFFAAVLATQFKSLQGPVRSRGERRQETEVAVAEPIAAPEPDALFRAAFDHAAGMALVGTDGRWLTVNQSLCQTLGYAESELRLGSFQDVIFPDDVGSFQTQVRKLLDGKISSYQVEQRYVHKRGHVVWGLLNMSMVRTVENTPAYLVFQIQDITDRKQTEERLVHDVFHDALTGLPNRALFMDRLKRAAERARRRKDNSFAVMFLDLDQFKLINDSLGHMFGDQLLIEVARRLTAALRTTDTVARIGGDEFTILLEDLNSQDESLRIVERLQADLSRPFKLGNKEVPVTASIGIAPHRTDYKQIDEIVHDADAAMYQAKTAGKARYVLHVEDVVAPPSKMHQIEAEIALAVDRNQLSLHYQPIVSLENGSLLGFEALARWQHPQKGMISPVDFIPVAEANGSIVEIGLWVLREACWQLRRWLDECPAGRTLTMSVNLSARQFMQPDLIDQIINILQETNLDPTLLKLEITESVVIENIGSACGTLQQLRALGIELSIDDFGTGYSSLSYLHRLPFNTLKIDRSFVTSMVESDDHAEIVRTVVTLAQKLGMKIIAEGVETMEQLVQLRRLNCEAGQGFLFSKPVDADTAGELASADSHWQTTMVCAQAGSRPQAVDAMSQPRIPRQQRSTLLRAV